MQRGENYTFLLTIRVDYHLEGFISKISRNEIFHGFLALISDSLPSWFFCIRQRGGIRAVDACSSGCYNFGSISRARRSPEGFSEIVKLSTDPTKVRAWVRAACVCTLVGRLCGVAERGRVGLKRGRRESILSSSILTRGSQWLLVSALRQQRGEKRSRHLPFSHRTLLRFVMAIYKLPRWSWKSSRKRWNFSLRCVTMIFLHSSSCQRIQCSVLDESGYRSEKIEWNHGALLA